MLALNFDNILLPTTGTGLVNINDPSLKIGNVIGAILPYIFGAAGIALLVYLVIGGLQMMTSRGDPKAMQSAQAKITNATIGFVIVIFAYFLVALIGKIFGIGAFGNIFR